MGKMNKEAAPNNNLSSKEIRSSKLVSSKHENDYEFSEELADGGERNEIITRQEDH
ncbi:MULTISPECIES: hypothetical protein [Bacillaceae]|uniref:Uncharacterized protein n=1 Tax=Metabacillus hrfriensis TaxID=3048891 RepID=A0ACD4RFI3_9BACI|nr:MULTISPECIES: hypothetical protein [Bacillaceae]MDQ0860732.1 hypothetical protein [Bacillus sp. V2I10]UAL53717.1 hypothetical protein K8L98_08060 [Metabacillus dongyingensis]USK30027.1 hypothetical protein LIT32_07965 [Bacillus sp. CMF21]WHZ59271.1 hypothetical protein QLQ22_08080 [Metabacillus sp. CT-WN-B3]